MNIYWGDIHNHCGITYGFGSLSNAIQRAKSQLDFAAFTGHAMWPDMYARTEETAYIVDFHKKGFQKLKKNWEQIRKEIARANSEELITFQGYEMHSCEYGDYHFLSMDDMLPLCDYRSPEELVTDIGTEVIAIPHHIGYTPGYRGINWDKYNSSFSPVVEVYSKHGCAMNERADYPYYHDMGPRDTRNMVEEGLRRGYHFGFAASTDHHAGFPGSYGDGLMAVLAEQKDRLSLWNAIRNRRTYAVTGDRIRCEFKINGEWMGSELRADERRLELRVETEDYLDKLIVYKNYKPLSILNGESFQQINKSGCYKIRIEMGWGTADLFRWNGEADVHGGSIVSYNTYFRGRSVLSPTETGGNMEDTINDIRTFADLQDHKHLSWSCDTVGNKSTLHPSTSSIVFKVQGSLNTELHFLINGNAVVMTINELLRYGYTKHIHYYHSQAFKIWKAIPEKQYTFEWAQVDYAAENQWDYYHIEISQKNRQWAYVSPIYVQKE